MSSLGVGRTGIAIIYIMIAIPIVLAFCSLAVDFARVRLAKSQMRHAAMAAALYGVTGLSNSTYVTKAQSAAASNTVNGASFSCSAADILSGTWSAGAGFTSGGSNPNTLQISAHLTGTSGIPLIFAPVVGQSYCNVTSTVVAVTTTNPPGGFVGYNGVDFKNNTFWASYNSSVTTSPSHSNYNNNGMIGTNSTIAGKNNNSLYGDTYLGPSASVSGITVSRSNLSQASNLVLPTMPTWAPGTNPNSTPTAYTVGSNTTLPAGTYWFTSLTLNANLTFSGASTVYVNGNIVTNGDLTAYNSIPSNLQIYQYGSGNTFGDTGSNNFNIIADVWAPAVDFASKNNLTYKGRGFFNTITCKNNADFYYDESFGTAAGGTVVKLTSIR